MARKNMTGNSAGGRFETGSIDVDKYSFEPFELVIAPVTTQYIQSKPVTKIELGEIINPRVIRIHPTAEDKRAEPINTEVDAPKLAALLDAAKAWYQTLEKGYDEELTARFNSAIDQLMEDLDGMRYIQTEPVGFYQYLADLYMAM